MNMKRYTRIYTYTHIHFKYGILLTKFYDYNGLLYLIFFSVVVIYVHHIIILYAQQKFQIYQRACPLNKQDKGFRALHDTWLA